MKKYYLAGVVFYFLFIGSADGQMSGADFRKLNWLEGTWIMTHTKPGRSGNESWKKSGEEWQGVSVSLKGTDTTSLEKMKIILKNGVIYYIADVPENKEPVSFRFTSITENSFVCENPEHDFPKKISYEKNGNTLKAIISGDGKSIEYLFEKK